MQPSVLHIVIDVMCCRDVYYTQESLDCLRGRDLSLYGGGTVVMQNILAKVDYINFYEGCAQNGHAGRGYLPHTSYESST